MICPNCIAKLKELKESPWHDWLWIKDIGSDKTTIMFNHGHHLGEDGHYHMSWYCEKCGYVFKHEVRTNG